MNFFFTAISLLALCVLSVGFVVFAKCKAAFAPLGAVCFTLLYFSFFALFDLLRIGGYIFFALTAILLVYIILKRKNVFAQCRCPSIYFFVIASVAVLVLFAIRKPLFTTWDEFSFWGTAAKLVKLDNSLYVDANIQWAWTATQKPGLILFGYFFDFFGTHAEWRVALAYDVLIFSVFSAVLAPVFGKHRAYAAPAALILFLTPILFTVYAWQDTPVTLYMSALGDVPMGLLMGGALVSWFGEAQHNPRRIIVPLFAITALVYVKDTAFPLALIAAGIICIDLIFAKNPNSHRKFTAIAAKVVALFGAPVAAFLSWTLYLKLTININAFEIGGQDNKSMLGLLTSGIAELFGFGTSEKFTSVMGKMWDNLFTVKLTALGSGAVLICLFAFMLLLILIIERNKLERLRLLISNALMFLGFVAFYIFTAFTFVYVFKPIEAESLSGYIRYIFPYYIAWFMFVFFLLLQAACRNEKRALYVGKSAIMSFAVLFSVASTRVVSTEMSVVDYPDDYLLERHSYATKSEKIRSIVQDYSKNIYFVSQGDNGIRWFAYCGELLPLQLDYSYGGGTIAAPGALSDDTLYYIPMTQTDFANYLLKNNCEYVFVERSDELFENEFATLFSDELNACKSNQSALYQVIPKDGSVEIIFVEAL